jgi:uncharacterized OsmC-like protein
MTLTISLKMALLRITKRLDVSVAGCLGYDVLEFMEITSSNSFVVSVAGCLGYDVLE